MQASILFVSTGTMSPHQIDISHTVLCSVKQSLLIGVPAKQALQY